MAEQFKVMLGDFNGRGLSPSLIWTRITQELRQSSTTVIWLDTSKYKDDHEIMQILLEINHIT